MSGRLEENSGLSLPMILKVYYNIENKWKLPRVSEPRKSQVPFYIFLFAVSKYNKSEECWPTEQGADPKSMSVKNSIIYEREYNKFPKSMNSPEGSRYE